MRKEVDQDAVFWPLQMMLLHLGFRPGERVTKFRRLLEMVRVVEHEPTAAAQAHSLLKNVVKTADAMRVALDHRARYLANLVSGSIDVFSSDGVLDFGCGDGLVAYHLCVGQRHMTIQQMSLYDVADYRAPVVKEETGLAFTTDRSHLEDMVKDGVRFDKALGLTTLHHCDDPDTELDLLTSIANELIIIESVLSPVMPWCAQAMIDWLYNRGMHPDAEIPVPGKFFTSQQWVGKLHDRGFKVVEERRLGVDTPIVPENHHLIIARRK